MSDLLRKVISVEGDQENAILRERKFKKANNLRIKINASTANVASGLSTPNCTKSSNRNSYPALEDLLQCGICLERLSNPRMLPCQHTFCLQCLRSNVAAKNLKIADNASTRHQFSIDHQIKSFSCPICMTHVPLDEGIDSMEKLPKNLYLQSLLKVVEGSSSPKVVDNYRCVSCAMVSPTQEQVCQHCMQIFCNVCWNVHLEELENNLSILVKQLSESQTRLQHKLDNFTSRCDLLAEKIKRATISKVETILSDEKQALDEVGSIKHEGDVTSEILIDSISKLRNEIDAKARDKSNKQKVTTYLNLHRETSKILDQVNYFGEARITFDPDTFKLEQISEGMYQEVDDNHQQLHSAQVLTNNPFESIDSMAKHYKARSFCPKLVWNKCPRPAGMGIAPWDESRLYIAATDSHYVLIIDKIKFKLVDRLSHEDMSCPAGIAFLKSRLEVYVSDKWKHCIHVFSSEGEYLRVIPGLKLRSPDGIATGPHEELVICDTANDRVLIIDPATGEQKNVLGIRNGCTYLNFPTSVAIYGKTIIIADSGNNRIKFFTFEGDFLDEFGSFGKNPGQFRSAEVVAVDQMGFILVGDAGNARIQIFKPDGTVVKILGSKIGFSWISGILVTSNLDIITADNKTRSLRIF